MGEPSHNIDAVLGSMSDLTDISIGMNRTFKWLPCFNSIIPTKLINGGCGIDVIERVIEFKERVFGGMLHFQISCNSTNEDTRRSLFGGAEVVPLEDIVRKINKIYITNRTITLNFIVMKDVEVSIDYLKKLGLNGDKFSVKLIPLNKTNNSGHNKLETVANYENYDTLLKLKHDFESSGIPVVVDAIAKCEEAGLCCGQLAQIFMK